MVTDIKYIVDEFQMLVTNLGSILSSTSNILLQKQLKSHPENVTNINMALYKTITYFKARYRTILAASAKLVPMGCSDGDMVLRAGDNGARGEIDSIL